MLPSLLNDTRSPVPAGIAEAVHEKLAIVLYPSPAIRFFDAKSPFVGYTAKTSGAKPSSTTVNMHACTAILMATVDNFILN
jgi:hypothetical protein